MARKQARNRGTARDRADEPQTAPTEGQRTEPDVPVAGSHSSPSRLWLLLAALAFLAWLIFLAVMCYFRLTEPDLPPPA